MKTKVLALCLLLSMLLGVTAQAGMVEPSQQPARKKPVPAKGGDHPPYSRNLPMQIT